MGQQDVPCVTMMTGSSQRAYNEWSNCLLRVTPADTVHAGTLAIVWSNPLQLDPAEGVHAVVFLHSVSRHSSFVSVMVL
jgi:hypothetical protein